MENVKLGRQKRYQQWILKKYMLSADNDEFLVDIIRYICVVFHPPNSLLQSDMVPRWAMIGWLLKCIKVWHIRSKLDNDLDHADIVLDKLRRS